MTGPSLIESLTESLTAATRALGLRVDRPVVLGDGANLVVHLAPSPVVARVATLTAEMRGDGYNFLRRERDVCRALLERGLDVGGPTDLVDPGPHRIGGRAVLLLRHRSLQPVDLDSPSHAVAAGRALVQLSEALADLPAELGRGDAGHPWVEIEALLDTVGPTTDDRAMAHIRETVDTLRCSEPEEPHRLVHGDAHRSNVALDGGRTLWFDFEDCNHRPLSWDLASLRRSWPPAGDEACRLLAVDPSSPSMRWHHELRDVYALLWNRFHAQRRPAVRAAAADRLARWMDRTPAWP